MIKILTGPIRSYKTTTLMQWADQQEYIGGVLTPDVDGLRKLYNVRTKEYLDWQKAGEQESGDVVIGKFVFDVAAFRTAISWLDEHIDDPDISTVILDEIGPLELQGKGWDEWLQRWLHAPHGKDLIFIVREKIVGEVIKHYRMVNPEIVMKEAFAL
jgi:nucleoside-triphosphatase THEP1